MKALVLSLFLFLTLAANAHEVTFQLHLPDGVDAQEVSMLGSNQPLDWSTPVALQPDGTHWRVTLTFDETVRYIKFRFSVNGQEELSGRNARVLWLTDSTQTEVYQLHRYRAYSPEKLNTLSYTTAQIDEELDLIRESMHALHPSAYKYQDRAAFDQAIATARGELHQNPTLTNAYRVYSELLGTLRCSHTQLNPWNQGTRIRKAMFYQSDKLPFTFNRSGDRMFVEQDLSDHGLAKGAEVLSINGVETAEVFARMAQYITADGDHPEKQRERLVLTGWTKYSYFDIYYPLEFGSYDTFQLRVSDPLTGEIENAKVPAISDSERLARLQEKAGRTEVRFSDGWQLHFQHDSLAVLKLSSFATFNHDFDWKDFIDRAFARIDSSGARHLIIDIRGNEGGMSEVGAYIGRYLTDETIKIEFPAMTTRYATVPVELREHLSTWDKHFYDLSRRLKPLEDGHYALKKNGRESKLRITPKRKNGFRGEAYLITDASNSSATHIMATFFQRHQLGQLVGQPTGGNQRGLNGGALFFLHLPHSRIVVDIPLFSITFHENTMQQPNGGIQPDHHVTREAEHFLPGRDAEIEYITNLINQ